MVDPPRHAIVTGAGSGLGRALALRLAADGWRVAMVDLDPAGLAESQTAALAQNPAAELSLHCVDVRNVDAWRSLRADLQGQWPCLDLLVNNAGVAAAGEIGPSPLENWEWVRATNLDGVYYGCHVFVDWLKANPRGGHVLNTASLAGLLSLPGLGAYSAAKAAVVALSEALYCELMPHRVGVTVLCPGFFPTGLLERGRFDRASQLDFARERFERSGLSADDVAKAALEAVRRKKLYAVLPRKALWFWRLKRLLPAKLYAALARAAAKRSAQ